MTPSVSVVIPAYNAEAFLKDALDSVRRQSHLPLEVLVIDDGSSDGTSRLAESVPGVRCIHQPNAGVSAARNRGTEEAKGSFIAFLDADDVWEDDKLAIQTRDLREDQFAYSARIETNERLDPIGVVQSDRRLPVLESLLFHGNVVGTPSAVVAPRAALIEAGGFDPNLSMCADWDLWIRIALRLSPQYSEKPLVRYRIRRDSMSTDVKRYESDSALMLKKAFSMALSADLMARRSEAESRMWEVLGGCYWDQGSIGEAVRCARQSIRRRPSRLASLLVSVPHRILRRMRARPRSLRSSSNVSASMAVGVGVGGGGGALSGRRRPPSVSVVIPAYNAARFLAAALDSLRSQTFREFETVVVDDGSRDQTSSVALGYSEVRLIQQENAGVAAARNRGIRETRSEWVAFLDADDLWMPEKLDRQVECAERTGAQAVFCDLRLIDVDGFEIWQRPTTVSLDMEPLLLHTESIPQFTSSTLLVQRSVLESVGGYDESLATMADWDLLIRLRRVIEFAHVPQKLAAYRRHSGTLSQKVPMLERESLRILDKVFSETDLPDQWRRLERRSRAWNDLVLSGSYFEAGYLEAAVRFAVRAVKRNPLLIGRVLAMPARRARRLMATAR